MSKRSPRSRPTPLSFKWMVHATDGSALSGEDKVEMAEKMIEIAHRVSQGQVDVHITYDAATVTATILSKTDAHMLERASHRAKNTIGRGVSGLVSHILLFLMNPGPGAKEELLSRLTQDYLQEEQNKATRALEAKIAFYVQKGNLKSTLLQRTAEPL